MWSGTLCTNLKWSGNKQTPRAQEQGNKVCSAIPGTGAGLYNVIKAQPLGFKIRPGQHHVAKTAPIAQVSLKGRYEALVTYTNLYNCCSTPQTGLQKG